MKFPYAMLRDFVDTRLDADQIGDLLTMAGFELEGMEQVEGDAVFDIKVMSNRGDGLSVFGLAREVLAKDEHARPTALYSQAVDRFRLGDEGAEEVHKRTSVTIETEDCSRFACRIFENLPKASTPEWIQKRLRQAGQRLINLTVDLTNYVMLELGQPLHAFDYDTLSEGRIVVRQAREGEKLTTLNGVEHELRTDQMMICDAERAVSVAGTMGGADTEVSDSTRTVLLESAHFLNTSVRRTRKQLGLNTDASYRFERSVDPEGVVAALNRLSILLREVVKDESCFVPGVVDIYPRPPATKSLNVRMSRTRKLLGIEVTVAEAQRYLSALGFEITGDGEPFAVVAPTWRPDIVREDDVIEEIGRVHGFDRIPEALPVGKTTRGNQSDLERAVEAIRHRLLQAGFSQCISHSLSAVHPLGTGKSQIGPRVPASPEYAVLRNSILPSLADAAKRNGGKDVHLFEIGRVFWQEGRYVETRQAALLSNGNLFPPNRAKDPVPSADFFSLKGVLDSLGGPLEYATPSEPDSRFHPTRQATVVGIGVIGEIYPDIAEELDLAPGTVMAELDLEALVAATSKKTEYKIISRNPAVRRDIAFVVDKTTRYDKLEAAVRDACGDVLEKQWLFDVYEGPGIPEGHHSLGMALQLRKFENFTDEAANQVREKAVAALESLGATVRK